MVSARPPRPPAAAARDFYVWSDTPDKYRDARIIFKDFESSNWTWDPVAKAYYWHRFYSHQPDLNFDNPQVHEAIFEALDFWLELGVDGLRLDAVPVSLRARRHELREPAGNPRVSARRCARTSMSDFPTACCWPKPINGPRTRPRISATATSATWPFISRSCRGSSWESAWRTAFRSSTSSSRRRRSPRCASGRCSCATTMS